MMFGWESVWARLVSRCSAINEIGSSRKSMLSTFRATKASRSLASTLRMSSALKTMPIPPLPNSSFSTNRSLSTAPTLNSWLGVSEGDVGGRLVASSSLFVESCKGIGSVLLVDEIEVIWLVPKLLLVR